MQVGFVRQGEREQLIVKVLRKVTQNLTLLFIFFKTCAGEAFKGQKKCKASNSYDLETTSVMLMTEVSLPKNEHFLQNLLP